MPKDFEAVAARVDHLLGRVKGMTLFHAGINPDGYVLVFEQGSAHTEIRFLPHVYTSGKNVVDPINDFTIITELKTYRRSVDSQGAETLDLVSEERVEAPYSTWFPEHNFL
jgi:hypothetical protein